MLRALLAQRFRLAAHREEKELQGFDLMLARGAELKPAVASGPTVELQEAPKTDAHGFPILTAPGVALMEGVRGTAVVSFVTVKAQPLSALVSLLSREFRLPISDKTALAGSYDFTLEFAPQRPGALPSASPDAAPDSPDTAPNLITAVQQRLGLRLTPAKVRVSVLVVDSADQIPSGN